MEPTLSEGDRLLLLHGGRPRIGRLAVVRLPGGVAAVKRVTRREGDGWWVERDNPHEGVDSWSVGTVPDDAVLARVLLRVWPPRRAHRRAHRGAQRGAQRWPGRSIDRGRPRWWARG